MLRWRKGTCFQEWGPARSPERRGGQTGGDGATGATPTLCIIFRDPCTTKPRHPQSSIYGPISWPPSSIPSAQHFCRKGGLFCLHTTLSTGHLAHAPSSGVLLHTVLFPFPCWCLLRPPLLRNSVLSITALTPLHREIWSQRPSEHACGRGAHSPSSYEPCGLTWGCHAVRKGSSPHRMGLRSARCKVIPKCRPGHHIVHRKLLTCSPFLSRLLL